MTDKIMVFEKPIVTTQRFEVSIPNQIGRVTIIRKEVFRQAHNTACDVEDTTVNYEIYREVDMETRQAAIKAINKEFFKEDLDEDD
jgi:hypothetical protein